jgi:hypothetical protein
VYRSHFDFSQTLSIWHVVILSNILTQYKNNSTSSGGHFEFLISANLLPYGMSYHFALFLHNMKIGPTLWPLGYQQVNLSFFSKTCGHFEFPISTNSFPAILSPIPTPMPNFKRIRQHLQFVENKKFYGRRRGGHGMMTKP